MARLDYLPFDTICFCCVSIVGSVSVIGASGYSAKFYVDGQLQGYSDTTRQYWQAGYSKVPALLAVEGYSISNTAGIAVILSNGISTDESWKCRPKTMADNESDWYDLSFRDSDWEDASVIAANEERSINYFGRVDYFSRLPGFVKWIWTLGTSNDRSVYCRGVLGEYHFIT